MNPHQELFGNSRRVSKVRRNLAVILLGALVAGCAPVSPTASEDRALFERLCNAPDRDFIKRNAMGSGYAEARTSDSALACPMASLVPDVFIEMGYQYYECVVGPWLGESDPGLKTYRFSLENQGNPACEGKDERSIKVNRTLDYWREKHSGFEGKCIGVTELSLPHSPYIKLAESGRVKLDSTHIVGHRPGWRSIPGYITFSRARVIDRQTNEVMAERKFYFLYPLGAQYIDFASKQCETLDTWKISDVIKPKLSTD